VKLFQDDLPAIGIARLRASGIVTAEMSEVAISVAGVEAVVRLALKRLRNNGSWSYFHCPSCGKLAQKLKAHDGRLLCWKCVGLEYRCRRRRSDRTARTERLIAQLYNPEPARLHPRPGRMLDRRNQLESSLRRNLHYMRALRLVKAAKALERDR
jgi:hypothetical protein